MRKGSDEKGELSKRIERRKKKGVRIFNGGGQGISMNGFYIKGNLRKRPLLPRLTSYIRYSSDTTSVTPGFKKKTECIGICMPGSSFIHIETL